MGNIIGSQSGLSSSVPGLAQAQSTSMLLNSGEHALPTGMSTPTSLSDQSLSSFAPMNTFQSEGGPGLQNLSQTNKDVWAQSMNRPLGLMANNIEQQAHSENVTNSNVADLLKQLHGGLSTLQKNIPKQEIGSHSVTPVHGSSGQYANYPASTTMTPGLQRLMSSTTIGNLPITASYLLNLKR